jgi:hypothetical protein
MCNLPATSWSRPLLTLVTFLSCWFAIPLCVSQTNGEPPREQIGEAFGKPVYRDQIQSKDDRSLTNELFRLIAGPAIEKYHQAHRAEIEATKEEIDFAAAYFDKERRGRVKDDEPKLKEINEELTREGLSKEQRQQLLAEREALEARHKPLGRSFAEFIVVPWKFQRHLYEQYGGGRILWQQAGLEAFDATRKWLESLEARGDFKITDSKLREIFYAYWKTNGGVFLQDEKGIRELFLEPAWALKLPNPD